MRAVYARDHLARRPHRLGVCGHAFDRASAPPEKPVRKAPDSAMSTFTPKGATYGARASLKPSRANFVAR